MTNPGLLIAAVLPLTLVAVYLAAEPAGSTTAPPGVRTETFVYKKTPQGELAMHVNFPAGWKVSDRRAAIVFFFGGGWQGGPVKQFASQSAYLAGRGMVAACADYRVRSRHKTTPTECVEDGKSAVRWLRAKAGKFGIDPKRIAAGGGSAGGHVAACTAMVQGLDAPGEDTAVVSRPNLLVLYNPVMDMTAPAIARRVGSAAKARKISPNEHVAKGIPPAILYYGSTDRFLAGARAYLAKAVPLGLQVEVYVANGVGHAFFNRPPWLQRTTYLTDRFLAQHGYLQGKPTIELPEGKVAMEKLTAKERD